MQSSGKQPEARRPS